jgi:hypothetical protein
MIIDMLQGRTCVSAPFWYYGGRPGAVARTGRIFIRPIFSLLTPARLVSDAAENRDFTFFSFDSTIFILQ